MFSWYLVLVITTILARVALGAPARKPPTPIFAPQDGQQRWTRCMIEKMVFEWPASVPPGWYNEHRALSLIYAYLSNHVEPGPSDPNPLHPETVQVLDGFRQACSQDVGYHFPEPRPNPAARERDAERAKAGPANPGTAHTRNGRDPQGPGIYRPAQFARTEAGLMGQAHHLVHRLSRTLSLGHLRPLMTGNVRARVPVPEPVMKVPIYDY
ncbi:MAG: hypothetical protein M1826_003477 [Phylliscum demangeonii]|nr:MAG: hypothetical protein M1826_003477 [Phylliscum demangeonii]